MCPSKPRLEICVKKIWSQSHIYKNTSWKRTKNREGLHLKVHLHFKSNSQDSISGSCAYRYSWRHGGCSKAVAERGAAAPCPVPFTFPVPELLLSNKLLCGFWWVSEKNFNNVVCNIITCLFFMWQGLFFCVFFNHMKKTHKTQWETEYTFY